MLLFAYSESTNIGYNPTLSYIFHRYTKRNVSNTVAGTQCPVLAYRLNYCAKNTNDSSSPVLLFSTQILLKFFVLFCFFFILRNLSDEFMLIYQDY